MSFHTHTQIETLRYFKGAREKAGVDRIVLLANPGFRIYLPTSRAPGATHFDRRNLNLVTSILSVGPEKLNFP